MNYIYSLEIIPENSLERYVKDYFEENTISSKNITAFIGYKFNERMIMMLNEENVWVKATPEDEREIASLSEAKQFLTFNVKNFNTIIGFIGYEKNNDKNLVFKTKNMENKRDTGARCDQANKNINLQKLHQIMEDSKALEDDTEFMKSISSNMELSVLIEILLRYFNVITANGKKWFLTPELAIYHKIYKIIPKK